MTTTSLETVSKDIISTLAVLIKTAQIHSVSNVAVVNIIKKLIAILTPFASPESVSLQLVGEFFHVNKRRVRYSMENVFNYDYLVKEFKKRGLGSIIFVEPPRERDLTALVDAVISSGLAEEPFTLIRNKLERVNTIHVEELQKVKEDVSELDKKRLVKKSYYSTAALTKNLFNKIKSGEMISLKRTKRSLRTIVDQIIEEESLMIGMTTIKDYDEYTHYHSVNVSVLSVALGNKLGLSKKALTSLGMAALLHDIGKVDIPIKILNKPSEFTDDEWEEVRHHPEYGALIILKFKGVSDSTIHNLIPAFEHHINYDLSGYPRVRSRKTLDFFSRIITIADQYDAMTSARVYSRKSLSPEKALSVMYERSRTQIDPYLLKVFVNLVGIYPIGSLVVLNTREMGLVFENNNNPEFIVRPRVLLISDRSGAKIEGTAVDLMEKDETGNYKRSISAVLDPHEYGISLAEYLL
jgi:HD-GYP domain-containing protein (c-di-GMP phosphodiesterase class II)